jgi:hypothetical protein
VFEEARLFVVAPDVVSRGKKTNDAVSPGGDEAVDRLSARVLPDLRRRAGLPILR